MNEPYYSREQADNLHKLRAAAGGAAFDTAWAALIADVRTNMESGGGPSTEKAKAIGLRWKALVDHFTGGDAATERLLYEAGEKYYLNSQLGGSPVPNVLGYMHEIFRALEL